MVSSILVALSLLNGQAGAYPNSKILVEPVEVAKGQFSIVLDARTKDKFEAGHIPGARWVDHDAWSKAFGETQKAQDWAKKFGELGLKSDTAVVIYDDAMQKDSARIWWILRYFGHQDARLMNGGFPAWRTAGYLANNSATPPSPTVYTIAAPVAGRFADKDKVLSILKEKKTQIIDARSEAEHCGDKKMSKQGGAIPGALHLEWTEALDKKSGKFKSAEELTKIFKDTGIDLSKPALTHCQSGGRAAVMAFTLELMGAKEVANYYRGWSEWGNAEDTPIATPKKK